MAVKVVEARAVGGTVVATEEARAEARAAAVREVEVTVVAEMEVVAREEVAMVAVVTAEEVMARMQESKRGSLQG